MAWLRPAAPVCTHDRGQVTHGLHGATPCRLRSRLSIAARSQALRQFGSVRLFRVQRLCPSYRGQSCAACSYQYRYQSCGQWRLSCRAWWCAPRALRNPLNWLCEPLGAGARPVHPIRVNSRQRSTLVAFGAKRTLTEPRTCRERIYEYTPQTRNSVFDSKKFWEADGQKVGAVERR